MIEAAYADDKEIENKIAEFVASKVASHKRLRGGVHRIDVVPKRLVLRFFFEFAREMELMGFSRA